MRGEVKNRSNLIKDGDLWSFVVSVVSSESSHFDGETQQSCFFLFLNLQHEMLCNI